MLNFDPFWLPVTHWARLGRLRIIAEMPNSEADQFFAVPDSRRREAIEAFAKAGAKALIAVSVPPDKTLPGWERLGNSNYYLLRLDDAEKPVKQF
jgi:LmbE family N-acetylglucosaminyl deacetylase